jgi:DNA-binding YbaB/EbfC family protein
MANPFKGMGGGLPDVGKLMNLQKKMMEDAEKMQDKLDSARLDGSAGGGAVKAVSDGQGHLLELTISPEAVDPSDVETLQDLVLLAVREALDKAEEMRTEEQKKLLPAGIPGLNIPGMF